MVSLWWRSPSVAACNYYASLFSFDMVAENARLQLFKGVLSCFACLVGHLYSRDHLSLSSVDPLLVISEQKED